MLRFFASQQKIHQQSDPRCYCETQSVLQRQNAVSRTNIKRPKSKTSQQPAQPRQKNASSPGFRLDMPMQIRFPVRSSKAAAEQVPDLSTSRGDLCLAPAHEAVLGPTSSDDGNRAAYPSRTPDSSGLGPRNGISTVNRVSKLPFTINAVASRAAENGVASCEPSSAGKETTHHLLCKVYISPC